DSVVGTTDADMMIFEVSAKVKAATGSTALFEPGVNASATSGPAALPLADRVGFLIVQEFGVPSNGGFFGTAAVVDAVWGLVWSYCTGFSSSSNGNFSAIDGGNYSGAAPVGPGGVGASGFKSATWFPTSLVATSWFVLPLGDSATMNSSDGIRL